MKKFSFVALLLCPAIVPALALDSGKYGYPSFSGVAPGHVGDSIDTAQNRNFISGAHPNTQTKATNPPQVKGKEGERRTYQGRDLVFHDDQWREVKKSARRETPPAGGDHAVYQGRKLIFHGGKWYYDTAADARKNSGHSSNR